MLEPALKISETLKPLSDQKLAHELMRLDDGTSFLVFDLAGVDYGLTIMKIPKQRERPGTQ